MGQDIRNQRSSRRPVLARGADGRLRPASETDIGDMWAQQKRLELLSAIKEEEKKKAKKEKWKRFLKKAKPKVAVTARPTPISKAPPARVPKIDTDEAQIAVTLSLPKFSWPPVWWPRLLARVRKLTKKQRIIVSASIVFVIIFFASFSLYGSQPASTKTGDGKDTATMKAQNDKPLPKGSPNYDTLLPQGKNIEQLGGWTRISPPDMSAVYAYVDHIGTVLINVSEQPLPPSFARDVPGETAKLAESYAAKDKLEVKDAVAYLGRSKDGPQSAIVAKGGALILIKSAAEVPLGQWASYIDSLNK